MEKIFDILANNKSMQMLCIFIVLDVIFGILRAIKEGKINSTIGIDGIIRKVGMMVTITVTIILDKLAGIDLVFFIPEELKTYLGITECGITLFFNSLYVIFESLSILKNMKRCGIPFPKKLNDFLDRLLKEFTSEVVENEKVSN